MGWPQDLRLGGHFLTKCQWFHVFTQYGKSKLLLEQFSQKCAHIPNMHKNLNIRAETNKIYTLE